MKNSFLISTTILMLVSLFAKSQSFDSILQKISENNIEIQASKKRIESKSFEYRQHNLPEGPEVSYGYFPNNSSVPGTKEVFEVSQSFQMPCYYRNHKGYSELKISQDEFNHQLIQQNILSEAKLLLIDYIFLMKKASINDKRLKFANDTYSAYIIRLELGDVNALEVNKAKLHLMQVKKDEQNIRSELLGIKEKLKSLNGGNDLDIAVEEYPEDQLIQLDSLMFDLIEKDPELLAIQKAAEASEKQLKVTKNLQLPEFSLGYGSETVADEKFKGVMVGLSIPLWSSKRAIQKAKIETEYYDLSKASLNEIKISETKVLYDQAETLKENLESYQNVLGSVNNQELLNISLKSGEISVVEFFNEMYYYYEIYDEFLLVERDYHKSLTELYKYKL